jgi:hypothetical protein
MLKVEDKIIWLGKTIKYALNSVLGWARRQINQVSSEVFSNAEIN